MASSQDELLRDRYRRFEFFGALALAAIACLCVRLYVFPYAVPSLKLELVVLAGQFLDELAATLLVALLAAGWYFWRMSHVNESRVESVPASDINSLLRANASKSKGWLYKGGCGRYTRATTISILASEAAKTKHSRSIVVFVLDPQEQSACETYAAYRRAAESDPSWTVARVQQEVIATAIVALQHAAHKSQLMVKVYVINHFSAFRLDISDDCAVLTKEDKRLPAIRVDRGTPFYESFRDELENVLVRQSREIVLNEAAAATLRGVADLTVADLRSLAAELQLCREESLDRISWADVVKGVKQPVDPYQ
jgi:hypothetical protein